jgi:hypothetical protein
MMSLPIYLWKVLIRYIYTTTLFLHLVESQFLLPHSSSDLEIDTVLRLLSMQASRFNRLVSGGQYFHPPGAKFH